MKELFFNLFFTVPYFPHLLHKNGVAPSVHNETLNKRTPNRNEIEREIINSIIFLPCLPNFSIRISENTREEKIQCENHQKQKSESERAGVLLQREGYLLDYQLHTHLSGAFRRIHGEGQTCCPTETKSRYRSLSLYNTLRFKFPSSLKP